MIWQLHFFPFAEIDIREKYLSAMKVVIKTSLLLCWYIQLIQFRWILQRFKNGPFHENTLYGRNCFFFSLVCKYWIFIYNIYFISCFDSQILWILRSYLYWNKFICSSANLSLRNMCCCVDAPVKFIRRNIDHNLIMSLFTVIHFHFFFFLCCLILTAYSAS